MSNKRLRAAHTKGRQAQIAGEPLTANPYKREDYQRAWDDGWYEQDVDEPCVVAHEPQVTTQTLGTVTSTPTQFYYYKNPPIPCPECKAEKAPPPIEHRQAVVNLNSSRYQALMHCRACDTRFILPVKYPPH